VAGRATEAHYETSPLRNSIRISPLAQLHLCLPACSSGPRATPDWKSSFSRRPRHARSPIPRGAYLYSHSRALLFLRRTRSPQQAETMSGTLGESRESSCKFSTNVRCCDEVLRRAKINRTQTAFYFIEIANFFFFAQDTSRHVCLIGISAR